MAKGGGKVGRVVRQQVERQGRRGEKLIRERIQDWIDKRVDDGIKAVLDAFGVKDDVDMVVRNKDGTPMTPTELRALMREMDKYDIRKDKKFFVQPKVPKVPKPPLKPEKFIRTVDPANVFGELGPSGKKKRRRLFKGLPTLDESYSGGYQQ